MRALLLTNLLIFVLMIQANAVERVYFRSQDALTITADLYSLAGDAPVILLCHQAGYSRGEYVEIAKKLNELGFTCMAIDQRSGNEVNEVINETAKRAKDSERRIEYLDAEQDITASLDYLFKRFEKPIIVWGSSYSASLALKIASEKNDLVAAVLAFSPGEYYGEKLKLTESIKQITAPVFITGSANEAGIIEVISSAIESENKQIYIPDFEGYHGSKALWTSSEGNEQYWEALMIFLEVLR